MGASKLNAGGNPSCFMLRKLDKHRPHGPLGSYTDLTSTFYGKVNTPLKEAQASTSSSGVPFVMRRKSGPLTRSNDILVLKGFVNTIPIRFVRLDSEHAQSDGKSVNRGPPELDLARGRDPRHPTKRIAASGNEIAQASVM